jgi:hypothetical protein
MAYQSPASSSVLLDAAVRLPVSSGVHFDDVCQREKNEQLRDSKTIIAAAADDVQCLMQVTLTPSHLSDGGRRRARFIFACVLRVEADEAVSCSKQFAVKPREKAVSIPHS